MSPDAVAELATSLRDLARGLLTLLESQGQPRPRVAGEAWSSAEHLLAVAELIFSKSMSAPPYTVIAAAAESASIACYLAETGASTLVRSARFGLFELLVVRPQSVRGWPSGWA